MDETTKNFPGGPALVAAVTILIAWLLLLAWLAMRTGAGEVEWARLLVVLGSLEAVAFAAAGAIFGTTVQRQRVEEARQQASRSEERAQKAEQTASSHAQAASNGRALAATIKARKDARTTAEGVERVGAGRPAPADDLVALAERLFPD